MPKRLTFEDRHGMSISDARELISQAKHRAINAANGLHRIPTTVYVARDRNSKPSYQKSLDKKRAETRERLEAQGFTFIDDKRIVCNFCGKHSTKTHMNRSKHNSDCPNYPAS